MDPQAQVALISGAVTLVLGVLGFVKLKGRPGLAAEEPPPDPQVVVQKIASQGIAGMTPGQVSTAVAVLAQALSDVNHRVSDLEKRELKYQRRLAVIEHIAVYASEPPPRPLPPWHDEPDAEG